jgi:hypothetical protein
MPIDEKWLLSGERRIVARRLVSIVEGELQSLQLQWAPPLARRILQNIVGILRDIIVCVCVDLDENRSAAIPDSLGLCSFSVF